MKRIMSSAVAVVLAALTIAPASAETRLKPDRYSGERLAKQVCLGCHGGAIVPYIQTFPSLNGQKQAYLEKQLQDFKTDKRDNRYMQVVTKQLSDRDIANVAYYYSTLEADDLKEKAGDS